MGVLHPIAEIQMEKKMDHEMETKVMGPLSLGTSFILWALNPKPLTLRPKTLNPKTPKALDP